MPLPNLDSIPSSKDNDKKDDNSFEEIEYEDLEEITDENLNDDDFLDSDNDLEDLEEITDENLIKEDNDLADLDDFEELTLDDVVVDDDEEISLEEQEIEEEIDNESGLFNKLPTSGLSKLSKKDAKGSFSKKEKKPKEKKQKIKKQSKSGLFKYIKIAIGVILSIAVVFFVLNFLGKSDNSQQADNSNISQKEENGKTVSGLEIKNRTIENDSYYLLINSANPVTPDFVESAFLTDDGIIKCIAFSPQIQSGDNTVLLDDCDGDIYDGMQIQKSIDNIKIGD